MDVVSSRCFISYAMHMFVECYIVALSAIVCDALKKNVDVADERAIFKCILKCVIRSRSFDFDISSVTEMQTLI